MKLFYSFIVSFFSPVSLFCETRFTHFASFIILCNYFFRKNTSFWPVFVALWGFNRQTSFFSSVSRKTGWNCATSQNKNKCGFYRNLTVLQKQAKTSCFYAKKSGKNLWNWQKVWNEFHKKSETGEKKWNCMKL